MCSHTRVAPARQASDRRGGEQPLAQAPPDELRQQAEVGDLDRLIGITAQLEITSGLRPTVSTQSWIAGSRQIGGDLLVRPPEAIHPPIRAADLRVEIAPQRRRRIRGLDATRRVRRQRLGAQLRRGRASPDRSAWPSGSRVAPRAEQRVAPSGGRGEDRVDVLAVSEPSRSSVSVRMSASSASRSMSSLVAAMSRQMSRRARGQPRRVGRPGPASSRPASPASCPDDVHQRAGGELRQMADGADQAIVQLGGHDVRHGAEPADERLEPRRAPPASWPRPASESRDARRTGRRAPPTAPPRAAPAIGWPPMNGDRRHVARAATHRAASCCRRR